MLHSLLVPMNPTRKYEGLFIFTPEEGHDAAKGEEKRLEEAIARFGGKIFDKRDWGRRPLGYALGKFREARILNWNFELETHQVAELKKVLQQDEKILKSSIVKYEEPKAPTPAHGSKS